MVKLLHTADLHLDSPLNSLALRDEDLRRRVRAATRESLKTIVDLSLEHEIAAVLISGDLFDRAERSARTAAFLTIQLDRLNQAGIRVFYIKGNHDAENPITGGTNFPANVHLFSGHGGCVELEGADVCIHGVSFSGKSASESLVPKFRPPASGVTNVAMMHTSVSGSSGHDSYAPCSVSDMAAAGFDYWALGHIHKRIVFSERPWIVMPGIPQGRDVGESGMKSATLIHIEEGRISVEELVTSAVEFGEIRIAADGHQDVESLRAAIQDALSRHLGGLRSPHGIVRVTLEGRSGLSWQILRDRDVLSEFIRETAAGTDRLWIDKVKFNVAAERKGGSPDATSELAGIMAEIQADNLLETDFLKEADDVFKLLPSTARSELLSEQDAAARLVRTLTEAGRRRVVANMRASLS